MSENSDTCPVCSMTAKMMPLNSREIIGINCPRCGKFFEAPYQNRSSSKIEKFPQDHITKATSAWIRQQNSLGSMPTLDATLIEHALDVPEPSIISKSEGLLEECGRRTKHFRQNVFEPCGPLLAITWAADLDELRHLVGLLLEQEFLINSVASHNITLSAKGIREVEAKKKEIASAQVFVAMSFDPKLDFVYDKGLYPGIRLPVMEPFRIDRHDHINRIDDEIIAQIRRSRFLVADFTGQNTECILRRVLLSVGPRCHLDMP